MEKDGIFYEHRVSNFIEAKTHAIKLLGLLKGCTSINGDKTSFDIGAALQNIGTSETQEVEKFILKWVTAKDENGEVINLNKTDVFNKHFNQYRSHYFSLMIDGVKFHFLDFLPDGVASSLNIPSLEAVME